MEKGKLHRAKSTEQDHGIQLLTLSDQPDFHYFP